MGVKNDTGSRVVLGHGDFHHNLQRGQNCLGLTEARKKKPLAWEIYKSKRLIKSFLKNSTSSLL